jgi:hypothetical protein
MAAEEADFSHRVRPEVLHASDFLSLSVICQSCTVLENVVNCMGSDLAEGACIVCGFI